jgi:outer membrane protein assembly factor BamB
MRARIDASPVISGDLVYVADRSGDLSALDLATGQERWRFETGEDIGGSPAVARGRLVVATLDGTVFAFIRKRGS